MIKERQRIALYNGVICMVAINCPFQLRKPWRLEKTCHCFLFSRCRLVNQKSDYLRFTLQLKSKEDKQIKLNIALQKKHFPVVFFKISQGQTTVRNMNQNVFFQIGYQEVNQSPFQRLSGISSIESLVDKDIIATYE